MCSQDGRHGHMIIHARETIATLTTTRYFEGWIAKARPLGVASSAHGIKNDPNTGIPGVEDPNHTGKTLWHLAPVSMAWETSPGVPMTGAQLCSQLLDPARNGNRTPNDLLEHVETEPLVLWSWNPGIRPNGEQRTTPPLTHDEFVSTFKDWIAEGTPCPVDPTQEAKR